MNGINKKIGVGVLWNFASLFLTKGATTVFILFLARLLDPEVFGLIAMATVVFELANVFVDSGFGQALVRSKSVSDVDLSTVFYSNLFLSLFAYVTLFFAAPYIADFYNQLALTHLIQVMGLVVLINATKVVQTAVLSRKMDFKSQMKANVFGSVGSGFLAVFSAFLGWGVWSLVVMMLSQALISSVVLWLSSEWHPHIKFSRESFSRLFNFGRNLLVEGMLTVLYQNSYVLIIGRFFNAELTGLYFFAKKISNLISQQLAGAVQQASFPALSTLQDDNAALKYKYRQIMQFMMFLIVPIMALLAGLASPLFTILFAKQWQAAVPYLQLLCIVGAFYPMHVLSVSLLNVMGRSDLVLRIGLIKKVVNIVLLFAAVPYGVIGIVISQVVGSILAIIPNTYYVAYLSDYSFWTQMLDIVKPIFAATISFAFIWWLSERDIDASVVQLLIEACVGCLVYVIGSMLIRAEGAIVCLNKAKQLIVKN